MMNTPFRAMAHQRKSVTFMTKNPVAFDASDPGTGKTFVQILAFEKQWKKDKRAMLVVCPKSLMKAAWEADLAKFAPKLRVCQLTANNREIRPGFDVYIVNCDGVKALKLPKNRFSTLVVDESEFFKHHTSQRSRALLALSKQFPIRRCLSGTPNANGICNLWHQYLLLDGGARLGKTFTGFRAACCEPKSAIKRTVVEDYDGVARQREIQVFTWEDRPGIEDAVGMIVKDITIRHRREDCVDLPENHSYTVTCELEKPELYKKMQKERLLRLKDQKVSAVNAAVVVSKLLQIASGAVYDEEGKASAIGTNRYELTLDLVEGRKHSVVFYLWEHQRDELARLAKARGIPFAVWDPSRPCAEAFQRGEYQMLLAHPASAGHGLTLTRATATIWASPTWNLSHYLQGMKRIHRIGQSKRTENIVVIARGTLDEKVFAALEAKETRLEALLNQLED